MNRIIEGLVWLVGRLSYRHKLLATALVFGLPLALLAGWQMWQMELRLQRVERARAGLAAQLPALQLLARATPEAPAGGGLATGLRDLAPGLLAAGLPYPSAWSRLAQQGGGGERLEGLLTEVLVGMEANADASGLLQGNDLAVVSLARLLAVQLPLLLNESLIAREEGAQAIEKQRLRGRSRNRLLLARGSLESLGAELDRTRAKLERLGHGGLAALEAPFGQLFTASLGLQEYLTTKVIDTADYDVPVADFRARADALNAAVVALAGVMEPQVAGGLDAAAATLRQQRALLAGGLLLLSLLVLLGYLAAYTSIMRSMRALKDAAAGMAAGDLRVRVNTGSADEVAEVGESFNRMAESFAQLIHDTGSAAHSLVQATERMNEASRGLHGSSGRQSEAAARTAETVQEMAVSIGEVAQNARQTAAAAEAAMHAAQAGEARARQASRRMGEIVGEVSQSVNALQALEARSEEVGRIVQVIQSLADQTNLLALNAAIEAARAGAHGAGFAVVADEVRRLADRSGQATREIDGTVRAIREEIEQTVQAMGRSGEAVGESLEVVVALAGSLAELRATVESSATLVQEIMEAAASQDTAGVSIAQDVQEIADMAGETHGSVRLNASAAEELAALARALRLSVAGLRTA